jgi:peptidoglycan/LPS O-acetylase OafA/YrhL
VSASGTTAAPPAAPPAARQRLSWPALDGTRAVACVAVLGVHLGVLPGGYLGVDVFFVLSGFLITTLLLAEHDRAGRIHLRWFWARRALRIGPALGCVFVVALLLAWLLATTAGPGRTLGSDTIASAPWTAGFAANWAYATGLIHTGGMLLPAWSLAIEEQFYLAWPLMLAWLLRRQVNRARTALVLAGLAAAVMAYRAEVLAAGWGLDRAYDGTDTRCDGLLAGCALAFWVATQPRVSRRLAGAGAWLGAAALAVLFGTGSQPGIAWQIPAGVAAATLIIAAVVTGTLPGPLTRLLASKPAAWTGKRSYGLYLWQFVVLKAVGAGWMRWGRHLPAAVSLGLLFAAVAGCFAVAALSYRLVESPALRAARRYR